MEKAMGGREGGPWRRTALWPGAFYLLFLALLGALSMFEAAVVIGACFGIVQVCGLYNAVATARSASCPTAARPWWLVTAAFVVLLLTGLAFVRSELGRGTEVYASAHPGWLLTALLLRCAFCIVTVAALLSLSIRKLEGTARQKLALDCVIVVGGGLMMLWYFLLGPVITEDDRVDTLASLGFAALTLGDLTLIVGASTVLLRGSAPAGLRPVLIMLTGTLFFLIGDLALTIGALHPEWAISGRASSLLVILPQMLLAAAAIEQRQLHLSGEDASTRARTLRPVTWLPNVALLGGFGLLLVAALRQGVYPWLGLVLGGILMTVAVVARQLIALNENRRLATTDALTGLANRIRMHERLDQAIASADRTGRSIAVLVIDLDDFKPVNDTLGHEAGDKLLVAFAEVLRRNIRRGDCAARVGGDEFVVIIEGISETQSAVDIAERIIDVLEIPVPLQGHPVKIKASIGVAVADHDFDGLVHRADLAMYQAKRTKTSGWHLYTPETPDPGRIDLALHDDLVTALQGQQFAVFYQPIVSLRTREIVGLEALVRWQHPTRGLLAPDSFIRVAEQVGLIKALDAWVLREACRQVADWQRALTPGRTLRLNVNVSAGALHEPDLASSILSTLADVGFDPRFLVVEITETSLLDVGPAVSHVAALHEHGIRIALDDFGTGYSSLEHLIRFPVDILKLDRCFVAGLVDDVASHAVADAVVRMGKLMTLDTVAEGVETEEQAEHLLDLGFVTGQGYHFDRPLAASDVARRLGIVTPTSRPGVPVQRGAGIGAEPK